MHFFKPNPSIRKSIQPLPPPSIWESPGGLIIASVMLSFRFSSLTNDFPTIDTAESINLPLSLEQITHKKILEEHITPKSEIILTEL